MSDVMRIQPFATQLRRILVELERNASIFDIHRSLFWKPVAAAPFAVQSLFGKFLATPVGPSAGPHTQLSQNIVASWLCGGRFIELKTVQVMDELVIPRPCIDMTDEGYNVEWSQELKLEESAHEYVVAWALVHLLPRILGWEELVPAGESPGAIFDMSLGYNLEGIRQPRMSTFMDTLADASAALRDEHSPIGGKGDRRRRLQLHRQGGKTQTRAVGSRLIDGCSCGAVAIGRCRGRSHRDHQGGRTPALEVHAVVGNERHQLDSVVTRRHRRHAAAALESAARRTARHVRQLDAVVIHVGRVAERRQRRRVGRRLTPAESLAAGNALASASGRG